MKRLLLQLLVVAVRVFIFQFLTFKMMPSTFIACAKCGKNAVVERVFCVNCDNGFHISCAKALKMKFINEQYVQCCEEKTEEKNDADELSSEKKSIDARIVGYILKQKYLLVKELRNQLISLQQQLPDNNTNAVKDDTYSKKITSKNPTQPTNRRQRENEPAQKNQKYRLTSMPSRTNIN